MQEEKNVPTSSKEHNPTLEELKKDLRQHSSTKLNLFYAYTTLYIINYTFQHQQTKYQNQSEEDEKVPDTEEHKENILHGPSAGMFIKNQKISKNESLNQPKFYFQRGITKEQEEAEKKIQKEKMKKEKEKSKKTPGKISTDLIPLNQNHFIRSENYEKLDYQFEDDELSEDSEEIDL